MSKLVTLPPESLLRDDGAKLGGWWHQIDGDNRIACDLCPRDCQLKPGDRGFCFVRENRGGEMVLTTYGRSTGFCIDPIEKKPLNHFFPGTSVLSFGTAGCNLGCKFCQNWDISKSREIERLSELATPEAIARAAKRLGCRSVAFTYNDPVIWAEYAIDVAAACHEVNIKTVAVTAGYITDVAREPFYRAMDAANVDLKAFTEDFYYKLTLSHLQPVLDTLKWLKHESEVWFEITNLVIPQANDTPDEFRRMCDWVLENLGDDVPVHFTAFHPDFRMRDRPNTPHETLLLAYETARKAGIKYVYTGNVNDLRHQSTYCARCDGLLIERNWYELGEYQLENNRCQHCGGEVAGRFDSQKGDWGRKRLPIKISQFSQQLPIVSTISNKSEIVSAQAKQLQAAQQRPEITKAQQQIVHRTACELMAAEVWQQPENLSDPSLGGAARTVVMGAFVTAKRQGRLRGCCGALGQPFSLLDALRPAAVRTANQDVRMPPISPTELALLDISVTLLFGFTPIEARGADRVRHVVVGRHGLKIQLGDASGLLLPSVAPENAWDSQQFLQQVCRKAGLPVTAWQDDSAQISTFEGMSISAPFDTAALSSDNAVALPPLSMDEFSRLCQHTHTNLIALVTGATPNYYITDVSDGTVSGIAITLGRAGSDDVQHVSKISLRPGLPLQSTLFTLIENTANSLRQQGSDPAVANQLQIGLTILHDPTMNGTLAESDLRGVDTKGRMLMSMDRGKTVWIYDPQRTPEKLLEQVSRATRANSPTTASLFSLAVITTEPSIFVTNIPRPQPGPAVRTSAMAGTFYPSDPVELAQQVDQFLANRPTKVEDWPAIMVPHAGLKFSGRIAAQVFQRVKIPEKVIVIGPKHTRFGVEWAVAPHETWSIPGAEVKSDVKLAQQLATEIPGLELDAIAHQQEHAIEVELPFIHRLAPESRVVGIAIGAGDLDRCQQFANGLAEVVRKQSQPPLLVISSDMNHFATDEENRRLDQMAISVLERLDPAEVHRTVIGNGISMCGVLPAVIILETLKLLGKLSTSFRVAYGTSADVSGDKSRVVGYAGMLFG